MKRMKHPLHGFHHVNNANEEAVMRSNGWVDDAPEAKKEEVKVAEVKPVAKKTSK